MMARIGRVLAAALCASLLLAASCGGRAQVDGTDSNTHWLKECESDSQCGPLSCICGVCSAACDEAGNCARFGAEASCEVPAGCDARGPTACVLPSLPGGGGSGGSGGGGTAGNAGVGTVGGTSPGADCAPMDARSNGDDCVATVGYAWNGNGCEPIICGCEGDACDRIFATADDCDHQYRACYEAYGVTRSCQVHADCQVNDRRCCRQSCTDLGPAANDWIAANVTSGLLRDSGLCPSTAESFCQTCPPFALPATYAACIEGECRLLDASPNAACETNADCRLTTRDCCDCGGDFSAYGLIAVNSSFARPAYCPADLGCAECEGDAPASNARALCNVEQGLCHVGLIPK